MLRIIRDGVFLIVWLIVQFIVDEVKELVHPQGFDLILFRVFQVVFGLATLIDVIWSIIDSWRKRDER